MEEILKNEEKEEIEDEGEESEIFPKKIKVPREDKRWIFPIHCGYMYKFSKFALKKMFWSKRYFILDLHSGLWYFKSEKTTKKPKKNRPIPIKGVKFWFSGVKRNCIEIDRHPNPKPFYFYSDESSLSMLLWYKRLTQAGGILEQRVVGLLTPEISLKSLRVWDNDHVRDWLSFSLFSVDTPFSIYEEEFSKDNGKSILLLNDKKLQEKGIQSRSHRLMIYLNLRHMKRKKKFEIGYFNVLKKITILQNQRKSCLNPRSAVDVARYLSHTSSLTSSYLSCGDISRNLSYDLMYQVIEKTESQNEEIIRWKKNLEEDTYLLKEKVFTGGNHLPVIIILSSFPRISDEKDFSEKIFAPHIERFSFSNDTKFMYTSVCIGSWYFEWNSSSLVIPKRLNNSSLGFVQDIGYKIGTVRLSNKFSDIQFLFKKIAQVVVKWNTSKNFIEESGSRACDGNCQEFVEDLLFAVDVPLNILVPTHPLGAIIERIRKNGKIPAFPLEIPISKDFFHEYEEILKRFEFDINRRTLVIDSHGKHDDLYLCLAKKNVIGLLTDYQEGKVLEMLDRYLWTRHFTDPEDMKYQPNGCGWRKFKILEPYVSGKEFVPGSLNLKPPPKKKKVPKRLLFKPKVLVQNKPMGITLRFNRRKDVGFGAGSMLYFGNPHQKLIVSGSISLSKILVIDTKEDSKIIEEVSPTCGGGIPSSLVRWNKDSFILCCIDSAKQVIVDHFILNPEGKCRKSRIVKFPSTNEKLTTFHIFNLIKLNDALILFADVSEPCNQTFISLSKKMIVGKRQQLANDSPNSYNSYSFGGHHKSVVSSKTFSDCFFFVGKFKILVINSISYELVKEVIPFKDLGGKLFALPKILCLETFINIKGEEILLFGSSCADVYMVNITNDKAKVARSFVQSDPMTLSVVGGGRLLCVGTQYGSLQIFLLRSIKADLEPSKDYEPIDIGKHTSVELLKNKIHYFGLTNVSCCSENTDDETGLDEIELFTCGKDMFVCNSTIKGKDLLRRLSNQNIFKQKDVFERIQFLLDGMKENYLEEEEVARSFRGRDFFEIKINNVSVFVFFKGLLVLG